MNSNNENLMRAKVIIGLWILFIACITGLILICILIPAIQIWKNSAIELTGIFSMFAALMLIYSMHLNKWKYWENEQRLEEPTSLVTMKNAPFLYAFVKQVVREANVCQSLVILLTPNAGITIQTKRHWNGQIISLRIGIGLALFARLSEAELGAILAHELYQLSTSSPKLISWVLRLRLKLIFAVTELENSFFLPDRLIALFYVWLIRLAQPIAQNQMLLSDQFAVQMSSLHVTRSAIEKVHLTAPMWKVYFNDELRLFHQRGVKLPIFEGFRQFCKPSKKRPAINNAIGQANNPSNTEFSIEQSFNIRMTALNKGHKTTISLPALADCFHFLGGELETENQWYQAFKNTPLEPYTWENVAKLFVTQEIKKKMLSSAFNLKLLALTDLPNIIRQLDDDIDSLWLRFNPNTMDVYSRQGKRNDLLEKIEEWVIACLIDSQFSPQLMPGTGMTMMRADQQVDVTELIISALSGNLKSSSLKAYA